MACSALVTEDDQESEAVREARHHHPEDGEEDLSLRLEQCSLLWSAESEGRMYLVASEDRGGMFYHLGTVAHGWINLMPEVLDKVKRLIVLVIEKEGVVQRSQIEVTQHTNNS